jgi:hypothetical protein
VALTNVPSGSPRAGWRSWYLILVGGSPRLMGFGSHTLAPGAPGQPPPIPAGQTPLPPHEGSYGGFIWQAGTNEAPAPTSTGWPWESAFYAKPAADHPGVGMGPRQHGRVCGAYGRVNCWGWTADDADGWTSQFAQVLEILVAPFHAAHIPSLASTYGVPVAAVG